MNRIIFLAALVAVPLSAFAAPKKPADHTAQADTDVDGDTNRSPFERLDAVDSALDGIDTILKLETPSDAQLLKAKEELVPLEDDLEEIIGELEPYIEGIDARLEQLGKPPAAGAPPESADVTADRKQETQKRQQWEDALKRAKLLQLRARDLMGAVAKHRRDMFSAELSARTTSILGLTYWHDIAGNLPIDWQRFRLRYEEGIASLESAMTDGAATHFVIICVLALAIIFVGPILCQRLGHMLASRWLPDNHLRRSLVAVWTVIVFITLPVLGAVLVADTLEDTHALTPLMATMVATFIAAVRIPALMLGMARAWLQPRHPQWRLVYWSDAQVRRLKGMSTALGILVAARVTWERVNDAVGTSLHVSILGRTICALAILSVLAIALARLGTIRQELVQHPPQRRTGEKPYNPVPAALLSGLAWIVILMVPVVLVLGYNAFAIFLVRELTQIAVVVSALLLLVRLTDDLFAAILSEKFPLGRLLRRSIGFSAAYIDQIAVLLAGVARVVLVYVAVRLILLRLGGEDVTSVAGRIQDGLADLKVGEVTISPGAIVGAMLVFCGVWFLTRTVRRWLENSYLPHTQLDSGARNSLSTGIGYLGFVAAVLMAVAYLGVSLDKVALIASALSVGVGFGLQAIISNFVSGLILLVERPIKVGDLVNVSGSTGDVKKISVRATEILLGDGSTFVVPNSDLISKPVVNKTRIGVRGQVQFLLRIAYGEDPNRTRDVILDVMKNDAKLLADPAPNVFIDDVDDRGYVFNIVGNVASPRETYGTKSDLFFAITRRLRSERIALGSPIASVDSDEGSAGSDQSAADADEASAPSAPAFDDPPDDDRPALGDGKGAGS